MVSGALATKLDRGNARKRHGNALKGIVAKLARMDLTEAQRDWDAYTFEKADLEARSRKAVARMSPDLWREWTDTRMQLHAHYSEEQSRYPAEQVLHSAMSMTKEEEAQAFRRKRHPQRELEVKLLFRLQELEDAICSTLETLDPGLSAAWESMRSKFEDCFSRHVGLVRSQPDASRDSLISRMADELTWLQACEGGLGQDQIIALFE